MGNKSLHTSHRDPNEANRLGFARLLSPLVVALLMLSCLGDSSSPRPAVANIALLPSFESDAAGILDIDYVRVVLQRTADSSIALDTVLVVQRADSIVDLNLSVLITADVETLWLTIECYNLLGQLIFVGGPLEVVATAEEDAEPTPVDVVIQYVGVGSDAVAVRIVQGELDLLTGDTITLAAEALDASQTPISDAPIRWRSLAEQRALVPDETIGFVVGGAERGPVGIEASLLTGQSDTLSVLIQPLPSAIVALSGGDQSGTVGTELAQPLVVQVIALDGLGVGGTTVDFNTVDGGSFSQTPVVTDADGHASTIWTLGLTEGAQTATATLSGYGNPQVTFAATAESQIAASGNVLVLSNYWSTNAVIVDSFPLHMPGLTFDTMNIAVQTPTVAFMRQYPVVLLYEDGLFSNAFNVGDSVAAYVQAGGNLVLGTFYWQDRSDNQVYTSLGWGALEDIDPFFAPQGSEYRPDSLDAASVVGHPLTQGVNSLWVNSYHGGVVAKPGTTVLARWSDACDYCELNSPLVGYRVEANGQRIVGVTVGPGYPYYGGYTGDLYRLFENALGWAAGGGNPQPAAPFATEEIIRSHPVTGEAIPTSGVRGGSAGRSEGR